MESNQMFVRRPKIGEADDDLLAFQEEFLKQASGAPSAKVSRVGDGPQPAPVTPEVSSQTDEVKDKLMGVTPQPEQGDQPMDVSTQVMQSQVVEKSNVSAFLRSVSPPSKFTQGFPVAPRLPPELLSAPADPLPDSKAARPKKRSLFMQQMMLKNKGVKTVINTPTASTSLSTVEHHTVSTTNELQQMMVEISKENEEKISNMSHEEIIEQQKKLAAMFDTSLLEKLKNRKKGSGIPSVSFEPTTDSNNPAPVITENSEKPVATIQKDIVDPISSSDLPFKLDDKWLHMDQLEHEKLRWLKPLDEHKKNKKGIKEKLSARFDFTGEIVNPEEPVGAASGLHHHGDEPEAAGYTLEELYILVRSLNAAQKVLALATLSNVLRKAKSGHYLYLLNNSIVNSLLQADIVLLLRYALDEKSELVVAAAVNAWHSLLCQQQDTKSLELLSCSMTGHLVPELVAVDVSPPTTEEEIIEREEEQYLEVLKRDVISGLLLMDFLPRLRYILEVIRPQLVVCSQILGILCRMMTSSETSYKLSRTPRLLNVVFEEFLPMSFTPVAENDECGHGKPLVEAMRFARCLCASGRTMAVDLIARHGLMERIVRYVSSTDPSEFGIVYSKLMVESLLTWRTLVLYGLGCEHYIILRPSLITRLQVETDDSIIVSLVCLLTSLLAAADATASTDKRKKTVHFSDSTMGGSAEAPSPALDWTQVSGLIDSVYSMAMKSVQNFLESYSEHHSTYDLSILISLLDFVHSYLTHARLQPVHVECFVTPQAILSDMVKIFRQLLTSTAFSKLLINIRQSSILLNESGYLTSESSNSLPSLHSLPKPANIDKAEAGESTQLKPQAIHLLLSLQTLIRLLRSTLSLSPTEIQPLCVDLIGHNEVMTYMRRVSQTQQTNNSTNYFASVECSLLVDLCQLGVAVPTPHLKELHRLSLSLVPKCTGANLSELHDLLSRVVFSPIMFRSHLTESSRSDHVTQECVMSLPSISNTYISLLLPLGEQLQHSRNILSRNTEKTSKMLLRHSHTDMLPLDWPYLPIMHLYQTSSDRSVDSQPPPDTCQLLKNSLQLVNLLETLLPDVTKAISVHAKVARVMCSFLLDDGLFHEPDMQRLLTSLLLSCCCHIDRIDFSQPVPGLQAFADLYMAFLDHFEATSFGSSVFSQYVLLPMMQQQSVEYRKLVWTEHALTLRSVFLSPNQLMFPMEKLLYPEEVNAAIITGMSANLLSGLITLTRNPVLYVAAVHHVNRFMFTTDGRDADVKLSLLKSAHLCTVESLKNHLIFYKEYKMSGSSVDVNDDTNSSGDINADIVCYTKLPIQRCNLLKSVT